MESALDVLSRAATMVNTNSDNRLTTNKELPTTKWRRDRRVRSSSEYHQNNHELGVGIVKPLGESNQTKSVGESSMEIPLDMSVGALKPPPPPYRDPLPGSTFSILSRPSVITQAPKRETSSNQENKESLEKTPVLCDNISPASESISMVDPVIDEHFRRSLGADYMNLFGKRLDQLKSTSSAPPTTTTVKKPPQILPIQSATNAVVSETSDQKEMNLSICNQYNDKETGDVEMSVDRHFEKALGETWKQLQQKSNTCSTEVDHESDINIDPENDSNLNIVGYSYSNSLSSSKNDAKTNSKNRDSKIHR